MYEVDPKVAAMATELLTAVAPPAPDPAPALAPALVAAAAGAPSAAARPAARPTGAGDPAAWGKLGRNDICPCGSGKKYKHCHGRVA
jgi:preprotein translocase subunit SecA